MPDDVSVEAQALIALMLQRDMKERPTVKEILEIPVL